MNQVLTDDRSYYRVLSTEDKPDLDASETRGTLLEVDTGLWYVFYKGTWYQQ